MNSGEMKKLVNHIWTALMLVTLLIACEKMPEDQSQPQNGQNDSNFTSLVSSNLAK